LTQIQYHNYKIINNIGNFLKILFQKSFPFKLNVETVMAISVLESGIK